MRKLTTSGIRAKFFVPVLLLSLISVNVYAAFNHPGIFMSEVELDKMKEVVNSSEDSRMKKGYKFMLKTKTFWPPIDGTVEKQIYSDFDYVPHPLPEENGKKFNIRHTFTNDGHAFEIQALMWVVTGDKRHADKAKEIMQAWCTKPGSPTDSLGWLGLGLLATPWFNGAEILRYYKNGASGWSNEDTKMFNKLVVASKVVVLSNDGGGLSSAYVCQNQNVCMAEIRMAIGIYSDDQELFDNGLALLQENLYTSTEIEDVWHKKITIFERTIAPYGEIMELNRGEGDVGHASASIKHLIKSAEIAWHQNVNIYEKRFEYWDTIQNKLVMENTPRLITGLEWWSKGIMDSVFETTLHGKVYPQYKLRYRGGFDMIYNHYTHRLKNKYSMPESKIYMEYIIQKKAFARTDPATHADLSKDLSVAVGSEDMKTKKSNITVNISKNKMLTFGYGETKNATVKLFTPAGRMVKKVVLNGAKEVSLKNLNHGLYLVKFTADGVSETKKLLLK